MADTHPSPQYLVDSRALLKRTLCHHLCPHFFHVQHERVQRFLDVRLLLIYNDDQTTENDNIISRVRPLACVLILSGIMGDGGGGRERQVTALLLLLLLPWLLLFWTVSWCFEPSAQEEFLPWSFCGLQIKRKSSTRNVRHARVCVSVCIFGDFVRDEFYLKKNIF